MRTSADGVAAIQMREGTRLAAYQDTKGVWTIGTGHTGNVHPGQTISMAQAASLLAGDLATAETAINRLVKEPLAQCEFDALVSFTFNVGTGNFARSNVLAHLNHGDTLGAANSLLDWNMVGGHVSPAIAKRREDERRQFLGPVASKWPASKLVAPAPVADPTDGQADILNARYDVT